MTETERRIYRKAERRNKGKTKQGKTESQKKKRQTDGKTERQKNRKTERR